MNTPTPGLEANIPYVGPEAVRPVPCVALVLLALNAPVRTLVSPGTSSVIGPLTTVGFVALFTASKITADATRYAGIDGRLWPKVRRLLAAPPVWARPLPAYGIGSVASFWVIERVVAFF